MCDYITASGPPTIARQIIKPAGLKMRRFDSVRRQPAVGSCCNIKRARQTCTASTRPMRSTRSNNRHSSQLHAQPSSLVTGRPQERAFSAEQDRFRLSAASPALDSSGGDEPPIVHNTKAVGEEDGDDSDNSSAKDIDSILAKARQPDTHALTLYARHDHNRGHADCRPVAAQASSQQTCRFVAATQDANLSFQSKHAITTSAARDVVAHISACLPASPYLMPASCWCVHHKAVISYAASHICMMPMNACVQHRVMATSDFYALLMSRQGMSLLAADSGSSLKHTSQTHYSSHNSFCNIWQALGCCLLLSGRLATCCLVYNPAGSFSKGSPAHIRRAPMAEAGVHTPSRQSVQACASLQEPHAGQPKVPNGACH